MFAQWDGQQLERLTDPSLLGGLALLLALVVIAVLAVRAARGGDEAKEEDASTMLSRFRELHENGELSDEEFKSIRLNLGRKIQAQVDPKVGREVDHTGDAG